MDSRGEVRFDGWTLRRSTGELSRDGVTVRLQVQPLTVLEELLASPGEIVTREHLIARLWPRGVVDFDTALNSAVRRLRTALGDHADTPRYIETLPKRGYRFIGTVDSDTDPADVPAVPSVEPASSPSRSADAGPRRQPVLWTAVAAAALCALAVGGWSWMRGQRAEHDERVASVSSATAAIPAAAQQRFRQARFLLQRRGEGDVELARRRFEEALRQHPRYAEAWAGIASTWTLDVLEGHVEPASGWEQVRAAAMKALEIDPRNAEAHLRLASRARHTGDEAAAEEHVRRAMASDPDDPLVLSVAAGRALDRGALDEAIELQRRAAQADPLAAVMRHNLAMMLFAAGRYDEARAELLALREIGPALQPASDVVLAQSMILSGDYAGALEFSARIEDEPTRLQARALALHGLGRPDESDAALRQLAESAHGGRAVLLAEAHAFRGETTAAFARLEEVAASDTSYCLGGRCWSNSWLVRLPLLQTLRDDERWAPFVAGIERRQRS
jgi:DNA-binding winged helix-turn-helix (wHTH) protein/tetratricopeptide (TPR) repeat protein